MNNASRASLVVLVAVVAGLAWWAIGSGDTGTAPPPVVRADEDVEPDLGMEAPKPRRATVEEITPVETAAPIAVEDPEQTEATHAAAPDEQEPLVTVGGRVLVVDEQGVERPAGGGSFLLRTWEGRRSTEQPRSVPIDAGRWTADVPTGRTLQATEVALDGLDVLLVRFGDTDTVPGAHIAPVPDDGVLDIVVRTVRSSVLIVRSARTGLDLSDVELRACGGWRHGDGPHEPEDDEDCVAFDGLSSPIDLDEVVVATLGRLASCVLWARAPGHAWGTLEADFRLGGERLLVLDDAGGLEVLVRGVRRADRPVVRVFTADEADDTPVRERPLLEDGTLTFPSLAPGSYRVAAQLGEWYREPHDLASATVEVRPGATSTTTLLLEFAGEIVRAPLAGRLVVPAAWEVERVFLTAKLLDTPVGGQQARMSLHDASLEPVPDAPDTRSWRFPDVQPGRWELGVHEPSFSIVVDVPPEGREDVLVEIPPPATVDLTIRDAGTGELADIARILWNPRRPEGVTGGSLESVDRDPDTGRFLFRAPRGEVVVRIHEPAYAFFMETLVVGPGRSVHELELSRACGITLVLHDGETTVPWDHAWGMPHLARAGEEANGLRGMRPGADDLGITVAEPGAWQLTLPEIPGFEAVAERTVEVPAAGYAEVVVELVRRA